MLSDDRLPRRVQPSPTPLCEFGEDEVDQNAAGLGSVTLKASLARRSPIGKPPPKCIDNIPELHNPTGDATVEWCVEDCLAFCANSLEPGKNS